MKEPISVLGYEHTGVFFKDTAAAAAWFTAVFAAKEISRSNDERPVIFLSFGNSSLLELIPAIDPATAEPNDHAHFSLAVADIDSALRGLQEHGTALEKPPFIAYEGSPVAFFRDPEGNLMQLAERRSPFNMPYDV